MTNKIRALCIALAVFTVGCGNDNAAPTTPTSPSSPVTENVSSTVAVGGLTSHAFTISKGGTVTVTLTSLGAPTTVMGLGLGFYSPGNAVCSLSTSLNTAAGTAAQISVAVDAGSYCVAIYDIGNLAAPTGFTFSIVHP